MITLGRAAFQKELRYSEYYCISTDEQDTWPIDGVQNGSKMYIMDSGEIYSFDEENQTWVAPQ